MSGPLPWGRRGGRGGRLLPVVGPVRVGQGEGRRLGPKLHPPEAARSSRRCVGVLGRVIWPRPSGPTGRWRGTPPLVRRTAPREGRRGGRLGGPAGRFGWRPPEVASLARAV